MEQLKIKYDMEVEELNSKIRKLEKRPNNNKNSVDRFKDDPKLFIVYTASKTMTCLKPFFTSCDQQFTS